MNYGIVILAMRWKNISELTNKGNFGYNIGTVKEQEQR